MPTNVRLGINILSIFFQFSGPKSLQIRTKIDTQINEKLDRIVASIFVRFWTVLVPILGAKTGGKLGGSWGEIRLDIVLGRPWTPQGAPKPRKTRLRPAQSPPRPPKTLKMAAKSVQNWSQIHSKRCFGGSLRHLLKRGGGCWPKALDLDKSKVNQDKSR